MHVSLPGSEGIRYKLVIPDQNWNRHAVLHVSTDRGGD